MHNDPIYLLEPVFHWLDELICRDGDYLYMALVYISLPLIIWILSGGLRRRFPQRRNIVAVPIVVIWPTAAPQPIPSDSGDRYRPPNDDDSQSFAT